MRTLKVLIQNLTFKNQNKIEYKKNYEIQSNRDVESKTILLKNSTNFLSWWIQSDIFMMLWRFQLESFRHFKAIRNLRTSKGF